MIASLRGTVLLKQGNAVALEVQGVGYEVFVPLRLAETLVLDTDTTLYCHQHVRENVLELYGFSSLAERAMFKMLISVSGVGPKSALAILDIAKIQELTRAIDAADPNLLTQIAGIGPKLAGRIILELKNKLKENGEETYSADSDVIEGLVGLGYTRKQARDAVRSVPVSVTDASERLREALKFLGK